MMGLALSISSAKPGRLPVGRASAAVLASLSAALAAPCAAQVEFESPIQGSVTSSGLEVTPSIKALYDDNIFRTDEEQVASANDIIVTPALTAQLNKPLGPHFLQANVTALYDHYTDLTNRSRLNLDGSLGARLSMAGVCRAEPYGRFRRARADYGDINTNVDNQQEFSTLSLQLSCPRRAGLYPIAKYERETTHNDPEFDFSNRTSNGYALGMVYSRPSLGDLTAYYKYTKTDRYDIGVVNKVNRYGMTFHRAVVSHISFDVDLHWLDVQSNVPDIQEYHGLAWNASAVIRPLSTVLLRLETGRAVVTDSLIATGYAITSNYQATLRYQLGERASARIGYEYESRDFRRNPALAFDTIDSDKVYTLTAGLERSISARVNVALAGLRVMRRTNDGSRDYEANQISVGASYSF